MWTNQSSRVPTISCLSIADIQSSKIQFDMNNEFENQIVQHKASYQFRGRVLNEYLHAFETLMILMGVQIQVRNQMCYSCLPFRYNFSYLEGIWKWLRLYATIENMGKIVRQQHCSVIKLHFCRSLPHRGQRVELN